MKQNRYYLSKSGQVTGPYLDDDILKFEKTGEIFSFSWIWQEGKGEWRPIDPAPEGNPEVRAKAAVSSFVDSNLADPVSDSDFKSPSAQQRLQQAPTEISMASGSAYCLWGQDIFKGSIVSKTAMGVEFEYSDASLMPPFAEGLGITLVSTNLDTQESKAHNMKIVEIQREDQAWKLFLRHNNA